MADLVFNVAKGKAGYYLGLPAASDAVVVVLLKTAGLVSDATMKDYTTLSAILAGASDEADFTNYVRKTGASVTNATDYTNDWLDGDMADITWTAAGGASNNTMGKLVICYDADTGTGTDADIIPLTFHDITYTTTGIDMVVQLAAAGFFRAA